MYLHLLAVFNEFIFNISAVLKWPLTLKLCRPTFYCVRVVLLGHSVAVAVQKKELL